ncbi:MAG: SDR family oxidoreductase [Myxococcota bacterium]
MARVVVVGSNRGIGLEICRQLHARGDEVVAVCRTGSAALAGCSSSVHEGVDVTSRDSLGRLAQELGQQSVDVLWVVAGVMKRVTLDSLDLDMIRQQFEVNALGPLLTVSALLSCLHEGSKVGLMTSRMGSIADNTSGGSYGYRMSKAALNMAGKSLAVDLKKRAISVALLHPGFVRTEMTGDRGELDPPEAAQGLINRLDALSLEQSGSFLHQNGTTLPW